jgi:hypothetical protein
VIEEAKTNVRSRKLALRLYDSWIRERQRRPDFRCSEDKREMEELRNENFETQLVESRRRHLAQMKEVGEEMTTADKVSLLVMLELPALEISNLLHTLSLQLAADPGSRYFSEVNQVAACGCGCG